MGIRAGRKVLWIVAATGIFITFSCTKTGNFTVGEDFVESQTKLQIIDSFRVNMYTVLLDSIITGGKKIAYAGSFKDNYSGTTRCESYFDLAYQTFDEVDPKAVYDSASFIFDYTGVSYGDTTSLMTLSLHKLTETYIPFSDGNFYNNTSFAYEPEATSTVSFYPSPNSKEDTILRFPVNTLGKELFTYIKDKDPIVSSSESFLDYLKGFILTQGNADDKAIVAFKADESNLFLKLYYHIDQGEPEKEEISVTMGPANYQFNHVDFNPAGSPLFQIKQQGNIVSSVESDNKGFMQGLVGMVTEFRFPSLQDIFSSQRWKILKAELIFRPASNTYDVFPLPKSLYIYNTDKLNNFGSILTDAQGNPIVAAFDYDKEFNENTTYTFDITRFLNNELSDLYFNYDHGLMISTRKEEDFRSSPDRLVIEGRKPPVKLRIYYLSY